MKARQLLTVAVVGFLVVWVSSAIYMSTKEPETTMLPNSKGTGWVGYRGLHDLQQTLRNRASRQYQPTLATDASGALRLFLGSNPYYVGTNLEFAQEAAIWIRRGGRAVVADRREQDYGELNAIHPPSRIMDQLLPHLKLNRVVRVPGDWRRLSPPPLSLLERAHASLKWIRSTVGDLDSPRTAMVRTPVVGEGALASLAAVHPELVVPQVDLLVLKDLPTDHLLGTIRFRDDSRHVLAALFRHGRGQVLVLSDERLLTNGMMQYPGMGAFAVDLLDAVGPGLPRVFDHFFLGETVQGNPAWLLGRFPYSIFAMCVLVAALIIPWSLAGRLGPPDPDPVPPQPGLLAQPGLVANLLRHRRYQGENLMALHAGVFWQLRAEFGVPRGATAQEDLVAVMERKAPERAARFLHASDSLRRIDMQRVSQREVVTIAQELVKCLSTK